MFHTLSNVQSGKSVSLQQYIDNRAGNVLVGLRSITYWIGWHNVEAETNLWYHNGTNIENSHFHSFPPGLYSFDQLKEIILSTEVGLTLDVNRTNGIVTMVIPANTQVALSAPLRNLIGLDDEGWLDPGTYTGDRPVNFTIAKALYIHLDQVNTSKNMLDGAPSTLLGVIPVTDQSFGQIAHHDFASPQFRHLQDGAVDELKLQIKDEYGKNLDNHGLPITVVLEFQGK